MADFWQEIKDLQTGIGAVIGLFGLALAALFNAHLNRKRDDRIRREESCTLALALRTEVLRLVKSALARRVAVLGLVGVPIDRSAWATQELTMPPAIVFQNSAAKIGLLGSELVADVVDFYNVISESDNQVKIWRLRDSDEMVPKETLEHLDRHFTWMIEKGGPLAVKLERFAKKFTLR